MARNSRWTKQELENTFEEFLKTSLSSEEDTDKIKKLLEQPVKKVKGSSGSLWWADESDEENLKKSGTGKSFLKTKKSSESPVRSKSTENDSKSRSKSGSKSPVSKQNHSPKKLPRTKSKRESSPGKTRSSKSKLETSMSKDSLEDNNDQEVSERSEEHDHHDVLHPMLRSNTVISLQDSSIDDSASYEGLQATKYRDGCDTLDEMADKQQFFQNLEQSAESTVDYGRLNQELSATGTAMLSPATRAGHSGQADISFVSGLSPAAVANTPGKDSNLDVSDSLQKPSMLSKVALMDSMDSTLNTTNSPKATASQDHLAYTLPDSFKTPALSGYSGVMGTNTSREMEDLQRVLQEAGLSPTIHGLESRPNTGKGIQQTSTPARDNKQVERSVGDILREMDAIDQRGRQIEEAGEDVQLRSNYKSPRSPRSPGRPVRMDERGFDQSHTEDTEVYQPVSSVSVKSKKKSTKTTNVSKPKSSMQLESTDAGVPTPRDRYAHVQSSGYGTRLASPPPRAPRSRSSGKSPSRGANGTTKARTTRKDASPSSELRGLSKTQGHNIGMEKSFELFTKYMAQHMATEESSPALKHPRTEWAKRPGHEREAALIDEMRDLREQLNSERISKSKIQADAANTEKELKSEMEAYKQVTQEEIQNLKQENFVLTAKLKEIDGDKESKQKKSADGTPDTEESAAARLEREIQQQETLLAGYQAENKRLYEEIKAAQTKAKVTEASMFKENQRLISELANAKQELEQKTSDLQNRGVITSVAVQQQIAAGNAQAAIGATRVSHLEGELSEAKRVQEQNSREAKQLQQEKFELSRQIDGLKREKEELSQRLTQGLNLEQKKELEAKHKEEVMQLNSKLRWYAENQELLDKSSAKIRAKDDEIHRLKMRLEDFKTEAGRKLEENKIRSKDKAADVKKIQDLERQVKEMEQVIRRRHPNSLPAMMMVAANAPEEVSQVKGRSVQVLETRIAKLEKELASRDQVAQQDVRAVQQKYNNVKFHYEERISDLERQLAVYRGIPGLTETSGPSSHPHSHALALERELDSVKERSRKQMAETQAEVDRLNTELNKVRKNQENMMKNENRQHEAEWKSQVNKLQIELKNREHDIELLHHTVEKLQVKVSGKGKGERKQAWPPSPSGNHGNRQYEPENFADGDMSAILQENQMLNTKVDQLQLELDQQRVNLHRSLAETESVARQNTERLENQIEVMRLDHQKELQRLLAQQALEVSTSRVAELTGKCDTQEVMIRHLQAQLKKALTEAEQVSELRQREADLSHQVKELQDKLRETKLHQTPEMRHFECLEEKLADMVEKQRRREAELDSVVKHNQTSNRRDVEEEVEKWKKIVDSKNQQLQVFRAELDSILDVLRTLQRQGVKLPIGNVYT